MLEQMAALRTEAEQLQTASAVEVRERMPGHLDRLEETTRMMERAAEPMRSVER